MIRRQREYSKEVREMSSNLMSFEVEAFYNFDTIKSFGIAPYYSKDALVAGTFQGYQPEI